MLFLDPKINAKNVDLGANLAPKMEPKWNQNGNKLEEKSIFKREAEQTTNTPKSCLIFEVLDPQKILKAHMFLLVFVKSAFAQKIGPRVPQITKHGANMEPKWMPNAGQID